MLAVFLVRYREPLAYYTPLLLPDGCGCLIPAMNWIGGDGFETVYGRTFGYPLFLAVVLRLGDSFTGIGVVQKALSLGGGLLALAALVNIAREDAPGKPKAVMTWLFVLWFSWLFLGSPVLAFYEHFIQPEALSAALAGLLALSPGG